MATLSLQLFLGTEAPRRPPGHLGRRQDKEGGLRQEFGNGAVFLLAEGPLVVSALDSGQGLLNELPHISLSLPLGLGGKE